MNTHQWYLNGLVSVQPPNTFIGGVSASLGTPTLLASKLGILESRITNFSVVGSDIQCYITGSYTIPVSAFDSSTISYYYDNDGLIINSNMLAVFNNTTSLVKVVLKGITSSSFQAAFKNSSIQVLECPFLTTIVSSTEMFRDTTNPITFYAPLLQTIGSSVANNSVWGGAGSPQKTGSKFYVHPSLATSNAGGVEGDIAYAITQGTLVRYVSNFIAPNPVTTLASGTIYNTAVQLNFTAPSSTNAIDYYEVYKNGVFVKNITSSGEYLRGLTASTSYNLTLVVVDILFNKSVFSNTLSISTTNRSAVDTDSIAYISASSNTAYQDIIDDMFVSLKSNSLYTKLQAFYPFLGTTAAQHKWNAKNPLDTNAAFRLTFSGTGTYSDLGFQCNGTNSYANTNFQPSLNQNVNSNGFTVVVGTNNTVNNDNATLGSYNSESQNTVFTSKGNNTTYYRQSLINNRGSAIVQTGVNDAKGIWTGMRTAASSGKLFRNNSLIGTGIGGGSLPTYNIYIGALNYIGSLNGVSHQRIQFTAFHEGLSDAEVATLHTIIDIFENALGRKTW